MFFWILACSGGGAAPVAADTAASIPRGPLSFVLPLAEPHRFDVVLGVDHDPVVYEGVEQLYCTNYAGETWPWCYDEHDGTDYILEGAWDAMDSGSTSIVAAASGVVIATEDGHYDHCHGDALTFDVSCDGYDMIANSVTLEHDGGIRTLYWHMMTDSVAVEVGQEVACGQVLGLVGSSGRSSQPHLHFEVQDADDGVIDPYAGTYSQPETWWVEQGDLDELPSGECSH